MSARRRQADHA